MSSNNSLSYKRAARILTVACGLLFSIFSIVYLFVLQKDVVGALHYSLSQGKTHYSPLAGAIIITLFLPARNVLCLRHRRNQQLLPRFLP